MIDKLAAFLVHEANWLPISMSLAMVVVAARLYRRRGSDLPVRQCVMAAMSLFFGVTLATMTVGHFLAVTTKLLTGTLEGSPAKLYAIGIALAVPSGWLVQHAWRMFTSEEAGRKTPVLNAWLVITLGALGIYNLPLAVPGLLNIGYHFHSRRAVGWTLVGLAVLVYLGLFVGSLMFLASGQSFEQFSGID